MLRGRAGKAFLFGGTEEGTCTDALVVRSISISLSYVVSCLALCAVIRRLLFLGMWDDMHK